MVQLLAGATNTALNRCQLIGEVQNKMVQNWLTDCMIDLFSLLIDRLINWLTDRLIDLSDDWLNVSLSSWMIDWSIRWLSDLLIDWFQMPTIINRGQSLLRVSFPALEITLADSYLHLTASLDKLLRNMIESKNSYRLQAMTAEQAKRYRTQQQMGEKGFWKCLNF